MPKMKVKIIQSELLDVFYLVDSNFGEGVSSNIDDEFLEKYIKIQNDFRYMQYILKQKYTGRNFDEK